MPMGGSAGSTSPATISRTRRDVELAAETSQPRTFCSSSSTGTGTGWKRAQGPLTAGLQLRACCLSLESGMCQAPGLSHFAFSFIWERTRGCDRSVFFSFCLFFWMQPYWVVNDPNAMCGLRRVKHVASSSSRGDPGSYPLLGA